MSARIIKAISSRDAHPAEMFNLVDVQRQGDELVAMAKREAQEILAAARREAEQTLSDAREAGRQEGLQEIDAKISQQADEVAEQRISERLVTAIPALRAAAESLQAERDRWLVRWEQTAIRLGVAIAEKLLQRQLAARPDYSTVMVSDALRLAAGQPQLTVHLHPDDLAAWGDRASQIVQSLTACADTTLVPDPHAMRGGCRIETRHGEIDARVETMLLRIAEELLHE